MKLTVQELIEQLQGFPPDSAIEFDDLDEDRPIFLVGFNPGGNKLTIVVSSIDRDEQQDDEE
ncbi:hypothetical protein [Nostoc sp.]|uniref:hypothetical protein n=1 Tax=Nostoc sp. TaxID=1180 RepID=UPI002FF70005